ncbi:MAG TPA: hypothetical protein VME22_10320 [Solirubrobacteraceae bacterium]|nr:hypothetical protein [Solirubrobacteraceae bacterium]
MTARLARLVLGLYPLAYRRRYGEEMHALLEDGRPNARTVLDLLRGALLAHLRPQDAPTGAVDAADRVRASAVGVLMCWVLFAAASFAFYKTTEDQPFSAAGHVHPLLGDAHLAVQAVALLASATVMLGALPLIAAALMRARRDPGARSTVILPFVPVIGFAILTAVVVAVAHSAGQHHTSSASSGVAVAWGIAGIGCGVACVLACRAALFATPVAPPRLRAALASGTLVTVAMFVIAAATAIYAVALAIDAGSVAGESNGPFQVLSVTASLIVVTVVMVAAAILAATATRRGWRVRNALAPPAQ